MCKTCEIFKTHSKILLSSKVGCRLHFTKLLSKIELSHGQALNMKCAVHLISVQNPDQLNGFNWVSLWNTKWQFSKCKPTQTRNHLKVLTQIPMNQNHQDVYLSHMVNNYYTSWSYMLHDRTKKVLSLTTSERGLFHETTPISPDRSTWNQMKRITKKVPVLY